MTVFSSAAPTPVLAPAPATAAVSRVLVSPQLEQEEEEDTGFPGVATLTQLPRFRLQSDESETEEEEDIVSSEAFRNAVFHFAALQRNCRDLHLTLLNRDPHLSLLFTVAQAANRTSEAVK